MPAPEMQEKLEVTKKASVKAEKKAYMPAKPKPEPKEQLPDTDKVYDEEKISKIEFKEKEKQLQLEKENHKIDKDLSVDEKLKKGWEKETSTAYVMGIKKKIIILKRQLDGPNPDAFVREYLDDGNMPKHLVGEQLFNRNAVLNLGLEKKLPSYKQMMAIKGGDEKHPEFLKNNFQKDGENLLPGYWNPNFKTFDGVGSRTSCWLADCGNVGFHKDAVNRSANNPKFGFSLRLLKD